MPDRACPQHSPCLSARSASTAEHKDKTEAKITIQTQHCTIYFHSKPNMNSRQLQRYKQQ